MNKILRDIPYFVEVARQKSFTLAADALDVPISTLSRRISAMEKELGVSLFKRNTRNVELTGSGLAFFTKCNYILGKVEEARDELISDMKSPRGPVRIAMPADIFHGFLGGGVLSDFAAQYPDIRMEVKFPGRWVDLLTEPFDLELRSGPLPDSNLRAHRLFSINLYVYASPALFEFYPEPEEPEGLGKIPCLGWQHASGVWNLYRGDEKRSVPLNFVHTLDGAGLMMEFLVAGLGAVLAPPRMMAPFVKHGLVKRILPEWSEDNAVLSLVMPDVQLPRRVRVFADYLIAHFASPEIHRPIDIEPLILAYLQNR